MHRPSESRRCEGNADAPRGASAGGLRIQGHSRNVSAFSSSVAPAFNSFSGRDLEFYEQAEKELNAGATEDEKSETFLE